jgi:2-acylglycerol O-acyltransferase 2
MERFGKSYSTLRTGFDLKPWTAAAAQSRGLAETAISYAPPRRRQLFSCIITFLLLPMSMLATVIFIYLAIFVDRSRILALLLSIYFTLIYFSKSHERGALALPSFKTCSFWKSLSNYFPVVLLKQNPETVFDPKEKYMFGYHPHGIISVGCFVNFAADANGVSEMFPGISIKPATLENNFYVPFWREVILRLGVISVSAKSLNYVLNQGGGNAVLVVPGGAAEALDAHPGTHSLTLNRRSGFFRIALQHGACLVPIYSFGENDLYEQAPNDEGTVVRTFQNTLLKYLGFATPLFSGAGSSGAALPMNPIPSRVPIITIVGDPIKCPQIEDPTREEIDHVRRLYVEKLQEIFAQFADKYAPERRGDLKIVK